MDTDLTSEKALRSRHYLAYVGQYPGIVAMFAGGSQSTRTTVHHITKRGVAKKAPDWWAVPVSRARHVNGERSIDKLGKEQFLEEWGLPSYKKMALTILYQYISDEAHERPYGDVQPSGTEAPYARAYYRLLKRLIENGKQLRSWNWP